MTRQERIDVIKEVSVLEKSGVISYVTSDRTGMPTQISSDQIPLFKRHIESLGNTKKVTVILYTRGGDVNTPWPIVTSLREHCEFLQVYIPYCAHSAGTLFSLGADEIVMGPFSSLSPIDPTVVNGFNPMDPIGNGNRIPIAVEEVSAYLELARDSVVGRKARNAAFSALVNQVHPLALGNVRRNINLIRNLAEKMIALHSPNISKRQTDKIVKSLITEFHAHGHLIGRNEARKLGLKVVDANVDQLELMNRYYESLKNDFLLLEPWNPALELKKAGGISTPDLLLERAMIETETSRDSFITDLKLVGKVIQTPNGPQNGIETQVASESWVDNP